MFHIRCYLNEIFVFAQKEKIGKIGLCFSHSVFVAPKIVLNKYLLNDYFYN